METSVGFNFDPQLTPKQSPVKVHPIASNSPRAKRKRSCDDVDMDSARQSPSEPIGKRTRSLPIGRPLPLSRLLEDLDREGLQALLKRLCEKHPGLSNEVYKHAPRPTVAQALASLSKLERIVQQSFPFGGDVRGEYAYNRVFQPMRDLLFALEDYVPHFLPPNEEHAIETLNFLDGATGFIARLPDWTNENHALMKREAFEEMNGAWVQAFRHAAKKGAGVGASLYIQKLRHWNEVSHGVLESALQCANQELAWISGERCLGAEASPHRVHQQGLFSQHA